MVLYFKLPAPIAINLRCTSSWTTDILFSLMQYVLSSFAVVLSFHNSFLFIIFSCPNILWRVFCFSYGILSSFLFITLYTTNSTTMFPAARKTVFMSVIDSVLIKAKTLFIFVAELFTFFLSLYLRSDGDFSEFCQISFNTLAHLRLTTLRLIW